MCVAKCRTMNITIEIHVPGAPMVRGGKCFRNNESDVRLAMVLYVYLFLMRITSAQNGGNLSDF